MLEALAHLPISILPVTVSRPSTCIPLHLPYPRPSTAAPFARSTFSCTLCARQLPLGWLSMDIHAFQAFELYENAADNKRTTKTERTLPTHRLAPLCSVCISGESKWKHQMLLLHLCSALYAQCFMADAQWVIYKQPGWSEFHQQIHTMQSFHRTFWGGNNFPLKRNLCATVAYQRIRAAIYGVSFELLINIIKIERNRLFAFVGVALFVGVANVHAHALWLGRWLRLHCRARFHRWCGRYRTWVDQLRRFGRWSAWQTKRTQSLQSARTHEIVEAILDEWRAKENGPISAIRKLEFCENWKLYHRFNAFI